MSNCTRPHCSIRSHLHGEFAKSLGYLPKFCDIAMCHRLNDKELMHNYTFLNDQSNVYSNRKRCIEIFRNMLFSINTENNFELKKLKVLYLFTMASTPVCRLLKRENLRFAESVRNAYYRALDECHDDDFVNQMIFNYRM
jgi:hypothetical protein